MPRIVYGTQFVMAQLMPTTAKRMVVPTTEDMTMVLNMQKANKKCDAIHMLRIVIQGARIRFKHRLKAVSCFLNHGVLTVPMIKGSSTAVMREIIAERNNVRDPIREASS